MSKILLIDGNSLMFRAYYATAYSGVLMRTKDGKYTNALFGFVNMVSKLLEKGDYMFVSFDAGKQTFRHQEYTDYKGGRKPLPEELKEQIPLIKQYLDVINIKHGESLNYEADDLIASAATKFYNDFDKILVVTGDRDLLQLVDEKIDVALTIHGVKDLDILSINNFKEKMGFNPSQVVEYKAIVGDSSDNLPGIKGIGDKTAIKLLNEYNDIEGIYQNLDKLTPKMNLLFTENKEIALKCRHLATLIKDAPIEYGKEDLKIDNNYQKELIDFYEKVEFKSLSNKLKQSQVYQENIFQDVKSDNTSSNKNREVKQNEVNSFEICSDYELLKGDCYLVCEVFGSNYYKGTFLGIGIYQNGKYFFVKEKDLSLIKDYLENENYSKYTFDYKTIYFLMKRNNIKIKGVVFDLLLDSYLINPSYANDDFKSTIEKFINTDLPYYENIYGANTKMAIPDEKVYINYSLKKCYYLSIVKEEVVKQIKEFNLENLSVVERELSLVLADMELDGLFVDLHRLGSIGDKLMKQAEIVKKRIFDLVGYEFNINSPKQLGEVLFEKLGLPHKKKNKTGFSTSVDVLEKLATEYEIARLILDYRGYTKLVSTYVNGLYEVMYDSFIHPLYKQALTSTGRLSSIEPNIQNMPIRTERGQVIREIFISRFSDGAIISADYSQIELRVLAHISKDEKMLEAFNNNIDIHTQTASQIYDIEVKDVTKEMRRTAKAINFGIIYGMKAWGLSEQLNIGVNEAEMFIAKYFHNFHRAKDCLDSFITEAHQNGYSKTMFGRRRYIPELNDNNKAIVSFGERTAMNSPIQGAAADIIKIAMTKVKKEMEKKNLKSIMIAQVHDELLFDCPADEVDIMMNLVKEVMESAVQLDVVLEASISSGKSWFEAK